MELRAADIAQLDKSPVKAKPSGKIVIVGGGQAAGECVAALRMADFTGAITIVSEEAHLPYSRPPLSKAYLLGSSTTVDLYLRPAEFYDQFDIKVLLSRKAKSIDRSRHRLMLDGGDELEYDYLILATGGRPRVLQAPGLADAHNVFYIRTIRDVDRMRATFASARRLVVIGGGYIGLEVAAVARQMKLDVTVLESASRLLERVTSPEISEFFRRVHTEEGVDVRTGSTVLDFVYSADKNVAAVKLSDGSTISADVVLVGIGMVPNVELAEAAGLLVDDGIIVDEFCETSDPLVLAIGDCTRHPCNERGGTRRLESVPNASEQARVVASHLLGEPARAPSVPWFWSHQYDLKLQVTGLSAPDDEVVVRGSTTVGRSFAAFYLRDGEVRSAQVVSDGRTFAVAKKMVVARSAVDPQRLADLSIPIKDLLEDVKPSSQVT